ncbi:glycoside hydrolase family 28 protein [Paenibacillus sp. FSL R10-2734]|uniref:glycoside hydrolase family 28 protein n=1 Tax=Paenibacillus sp. FSL R10-2734 TaxID=2954691 RepID=UPI0030D8AE21
MTVMKLANTEALPFDMPEVELPVIPDNTFNITDFGAIGDGQFMNTEAIESAMVACASQGGGTVIIPAGTWITGPIRLRSRVCLHTESGALIIFSKNRNDYPLISTSYEGLRTVRCISAIYGVDLENVAITGQGIFDGSGEIWRPVKRMKMTEGQWKKLLQSGGYVEGDCWWPTEQSLKGHILAKQLIAQNVQEPSAFLPARDHLRPTLVQLDRCRKVLLDGPTFRNSAAWNVHPWLCEHVTIRNVSIRNQWHSQNGDGLDLDSCRYANIHDTLFDVGDDAICIKSGKDADGRSLAAPTEYVIIRNCQVFHGHGGFVIGSEMSGDVRNILVTDCVFIGTDAGLRFKSTRGRGGTVEHIYIQNVRMKDIAKEAIIFSSYYSGKNNTEDTVPVSEETPVFRDFYIRDTTCIGAQMALLIKGLPEMPICNIVFERVMLTARKGVTCTNAENIVFRSTTILPEEGEPFTMDKVEGVTIVN